MKIRWFAILTLALLPAIGANAESFAESDISWLGGRNFTVNGPGILFDDVRLWKVC